MKKAKLLVSRVSLAAIALIGTGMCQAQEAVTPPAGKATVQETGEAEDAKKSWISGSAGIALTNEYIFFGLVQDKDTFISQPYLNLSFNLFEGEGFLNSVSFELPLWTSVHDTNKPRPSNGHSALRDWYEFDLSPGFSFGFAQNWNLIISDAIYTSPGDYFDTSHNLSLELTYDDSEPLGAFALHPYFSFLQELNGHSGLAIKNGVPYSSHADQSQYYELGIEPAYTFAEKSAYRLSLSFPFTAGFGTNGFFGQGFGFFSGGASISIPMAFIPTAYGSWTTSITGLYYRLGTNSARFTDNLNNTSTGRRDQAVISWSIETEF